MHEELKEYVERRQRTKDMICKFIRECDEIEQCDFTVDVSEENVLGETMKKYKTGHKHIFVRATRHETPIPVWVECTAGEALDAILDGKMAQRKCNVKNEWEGFTGECQTPWTFVRYGTSFRKEA